MAATGLRYLTILSCFHRYPSLLLSCNHKLNYEHIHALSERILISENKKIPRTISCSIELDYLYGSLALPVDINFNSKTFDTWHMYSSEQKLRDGHEI